MCWSENNGEVRRQESEFIAFRFQLSADRTQSNQLLVISDQQKKTGSRDKAGAPLWNQHERVSIADFHGARDNAGCKFRGSGFRKRGKAFIVVRGKIIV